MGVGLRGLVLALFALVCVAAQSSAELRFCIYADPKTFDPLMATEEASETIRYLTAGVLVRLNRQTQKLEPELAKAWTIRDNGRRIDFVLREGVQFSDGAPFGPQDVVATVERLAKPNLNSAIADTFHSGAGEIKAQVNGPHTVSISFSTPLAGIETLFDQLAISPGRPVQPEKAVLGPFMLAEYKTGQYVLLKRNPHYWRTDAGGKKLPYLDSIRLDIQTNREIALVKFRRGSCIPSTN